MLRENHEEMGSEMDGLLLKQILRQNTVLLPAPLRALYPCNDSLPLNLLTCRWSSDK